MSLLANQRSSARAPIHPALLWQRHVLTTSIAEPACYARGAMTEDDVAVRFSWRLLGTDAARIREILGGGRPERIAQFAIDATSAPDAEVAELLLAVGLHPDQETQGFTGPHAQLEGATTIGALTQSLAKVMNEAPTGFIVDTRRDIVNVSEHPSVGHGTVLLVDGAGVRLLSTRQGAVLAEAIRAAGPGL